MLRRSGPALVAWLLLAIMAVQLGQVASFELARMVVRREMKQRIRQGLPEHERTRFSFTAEQYEALEKEDGGREFRVDGHLYDLIRRTTDRRGNVLLEAVEDREEAHLLAGLDDLLRKGMEQRGLGRDRARAVIASLACSPPLEPLRLRAHHTRTSLQGLDRDATVRDGATPELLRPPRS